MIKFKFTSSRLGNWFWHCRRTIYYPSIAHLVEGTVEEQSIIHPLHTLLKGVCCMAPFDTSMKRGQGRARWRGGRACGPQNPRDTRKCPWRNNRLLRQSLESAGLSVKGTKLFVSSSGEGSGEMPGPNDVDNLGGGAGEGSEGMNVDEIPDSGAGDGSNERMVEMTGPSVDIPVSGTIVYQRFTHGRFRNKRSGTGGLGGSSIDDSHGPVGYVGDRSTFKDFLLKSELLRIVEEFGFEHPSQVQHQCLPQAISGMDVLCQAKPGSGQTSVFVLSTLQNIVPIEGQVAALVLCHTRKLAYQICREFQNFAAYLPDIRVSAFYGGIDIQTHKDLLRTERPHIVVGTAGRILALAKNNSLSLGSIQIFILDECDVMLKSLDSRNVVQDIFMMTPPNKQIMMFSATISQEIQSICKQYMRPMMQTYVYEAKLTFPNLVQHYIQLSEIEKIRRLKDLLGVLCFDQVIIFLKSVERAAELHNLLLEYGFKATCIHSGLPQVERLSRYKTFVQGATTILVTTDLMGRGIEMSQVNLVINYDMPKSADAYLHRVCKAGEGHAISFVSSHADMDVIEQVRSFEVDIKPYLERI